jgi:hypothetical protein
VYVLLHLTEGVQEAEGSADLTEGVQEAEGSADLDIVDLCVFLPQINL